MTPTPTPTMQQLTFIEPGRLDWHEVPRPQLAGAGQALVRPMAVTRCDLDLYIATGLYPMAGPFAFGHEIAGVVLEVGDQVSAVSVGDRVIVPFQINCGECGFCRRGLTNACSAVPPSSAYGLAPICGTEWGGGLSDVVHVPYADAMLVKIPESVSMAAAAALSDNAVDGYRTVSDALVAQPGGNVLVVGGLAQSVGLFAVEAARALGAGRVVYTDFDESRLGKARELGATAVATDYSKQDRFEESFSIVVEAGATAESLAFALRSTQRCGTCTGVSAGTGALMAEVPLREMYTKGVTYNVGRVHARGVLDAALECAACGTFHPEKVVTREVGFADAAGAMVEGDVKTVFLRE
jgi:threonine dehydrogenase-like Zn-dependent dehydrogenase